MSNKFERRFDTVKERLLSIKLFFLAINSLLLYFILDISVFLTISYFFGGLSAISIIYGFMFKSHGHKVSDRAYLFHYFVVDKNNPSIKVKFDGHVDLVDIGSRNIEKKLIDIVKLLNKPYPGHNRDCETCGFYRGREEKINN